MMTGFRISVAVSLGITISAGSFIGSGCAVEPEQGTLGDGVDVAAVTQSLFAAPTKAEIDAYAKANGFPNSDYPYWEKANGCGSDWYNRFIPDGYPAANQIAPCVPSPRIDPVSFINACNNHDHCYGTIGKTKAQCDGSLGGDIVSACQGRLKSGLMIACAPYPGLFLRGDSGSLARCIGLAATYQAAVSEFGASYYSNGQAQAQKYKTLTDNFINLKRYGVCTGEYSCPRAVSRVHRMQFTCSGQLVQDEQVSAPSSSTTCKNRYATDCASSSRYAVEWCDYADPQCYPIGTNQYACNPGVKPPGTACRATRLHRTVYNCNGTKVAPEQVIDLVATGYGNYTCTNNYRSQCMSDGSWDAYYLEWCEYAC